MLIEPHFIDFNCCAHIKVAKIMKEAGRAPSLSKHTALHCCSVLLRMPSGASCVFHVNFMLPSFQVNTVFDRLHETHNYTGYVIFLEEDHFVAPDFLEVAKQLIGMRQTRCTDCDFINLGMYNKVRNYAGVAHRVCVCVLV